MVFSLLCLLENPQNNLRIFANSHLIYDNNTNINDLHWILYRFFYNSNYNVGHSNSNFQNPLPKFIFLLLKILTKPLAVDNGIFPKIYEKQNRIDFNYLPNVYRQLMNLNSSHNYVFFRTFIQIFEQISLNMLDNISYQKDCNNNILSLNAFKFQLKLNCDNYKYNFDNQEFCNFNENFKIVNGNYQPKYCDNLQKNSTKMKTRTNSFKLKSETCLLHWNKNVQSFESELDLKCNCKGGREQ